MTAGTMTPTTLPPWTPKVRCNFTRAPPRSPSLWVLGAADATEPNDCCCCDAFGRARGVGSDAAGEADPPLEGAFQISDSFGLVWAQGFGLCLNFGHFVLTSPTVLCSASSQGSS